MNCEVGIETDSPEYRNITFRGCDLIRNTGVALDIQNGRPCYVHGITFEDINVEYQTDMMCPKFQNRGDEKYDLYHMTYTPKLISVNNRPYAMRLRTPDNVAREFDKDFGRTSDILYKNINVYLPDGIEAPEISLRSVNDYADIENIVIDGLYVNGEKQKDLSRFKTVTDNCAPAVLK